jgi:hypothetical protein
MTEAEWLACIDPQRMLKQLWGKVSDRKHRLFAVACCRRIWQLLSDERSRQAVEIAERYADAEATADELETASDAASAVWETEQEQALTEGTWDRESLSPPYTASAAAYNVAIPLGWWGGAPAFVPPDEIIREVIADGAAERVAQCALLRDIFGNPFRSVSVDPSWPRWNDRTIPRIAQGIYEERAFDRLPILHDALLDAGCDNEDILAHCRGAGPHVRGCWVIDLILGKE